MDREEVAIDAAALIAKLPPSRQRQILQLPEAERRGKIKTLGYRARSAQPPTGAARFKKVTIPWSARQAVSLLVERWPPSLLYEFFEVLSERLAEPDRPKLRVVRKDDG